MKHRPLKDRIQWILDPASTREVADRVGVNVSHIWFIRNTWKQQFERLGYNPTAEDMAIINARIKYKDRFKRQPESKPLVEKKVIHIDELPSDLHKKNQINRENIIIHERKQRKPGWNLPDEHEHKQIHRFRRNPGPSNN